LDGIYEASEDKEGSDPRPTLGVGADERPLVPWNVAILFKCGSEEPDRISASEMGGNDEDGGNTSEALYVSGKRSGGTVRVECILQPIWYPVEVWMPSLK